MAEESASSIQNTAIANALRESILGPSYQNKTQETKLNEETNKEEETSNKLDQSTTQTNQTNNQINQTTTQINQTSNQTDQITSQINSYAEQKGLIISKKSVELLAQNENWIQIVDELLVEGNFIIEPHLLEKKLARTKLSQLAPETEIRRASFIAQAKDRAPNFKVMTEYDVTGKSNSEGKVADFLNLFRSKFELLSGMLKTRHNLSPVAIKTLSGIRDRDQLDVIGIVNKKWITKKGHTALEIEDMEAKCIILVMEKEKALIEKAERVIEDNVIGIKGTKWGKDFIIVKDFFWPDLPIKSIKTINEEVLIGGLSDFHVGSKLFYEDQVNKLLDYLNGKGLTEKQQERVGKIQYLMVTGDNIAGIGVYPGQLDDLLIKDIYEQYQKFEDLMLQIPEYIQVFIIPGQHDAVRRAEPQPAIGEEFVPRLAKLRNFHFLSSPSWVEIEGLKNMVYHGPSVHDLISSVSFLTMSKPEQAMLELLKKRDLMPKYGGKNPYVPEGRDYMVIKEEPDLIWFGDLHHKGYTTYRGTTILNSGCWEAQTDFEKKIGHTPTPCIFPTINLKNRQIIETHFLREASETVVG